MVRDSVARGKYQHHIGMIKQLVKCQRNVIWKEFFGAGVFDIEVVDPCEAMDEDSAICDGRIFIQAGRKPGFGNLLVGSAIFCMINDISAINADASHVTKIFWHDKSKQAEE